MARHATTSTKRIVTRISCAALVAALGCAAFAVISGGYQIRPVLSGSMRPGLPIGGVVVVKREPVSDLAVRQVVVFRPPGDTGAPVVHRVESITPSPARPVITTKGDNNPVADPWRATVRGSHIYAAQFTVPFVGYPAVALHSPTGRRITVSIAAILLVVAAIRSTVAWRRRRSMPTDDQAEGSMTALDEQIACEGITPLADPAAPGPIDQLRYRVRIASEPALAATPK